MANTSVKRKLSSATNQAVIYSILLLWLSMLTSAEQVNHNHLEDAVIQADYGVVDDRGFMTSSVNISMPGDMVIGCRTNAKGWPLMNITVKDDQGNFIWGEPTKVDLKVRRPVPYQFWDRRIGPLTPGKQYVWHLIM